MSISPSELFKAAFKKTGSSEGALEGRVNVATGLVEYKHPREWARMEELSGPAPAEDAEAAAAYDRDFPPLPGAKPAKKQAPGRTTAMKKLDATRVGNADGVYVKIKDWEAGAEARLRIERESTAKLRADMTASMKARTGKAGQGVKDNSKMATGLAELLAGKPELLAEGGLLGRIMGGLSGQGQHAKPGKGESPEATAERVSGTISGSAGRLGGGGGAGEDGNLVMQFIGCFTDGLTEVVEGKAVAVKQFDELWPLLQEKFGLKPGDKAKLLERVGGYKQIAGAESDTLIGKGTRKDDTRAGQMPNDPRLQIADPNALIKGDISGSMHSSLLAQELAETLFAGKPIKAMGDPVLVKDKGSLDARAADAIAMTAGGRSGDEDKVFHTAYEMINGMQAISGAPPVSQVMATEIMSRMTGGMTYTAAMESLHKGTKLPWQ